MALRNQKQVLAQMDHMAGLALGRVAKDYRRTIGAEIMKAIEGAKSAEGLARRLNPALLRRMKSDEVDDAIAETNVQAALIGRTTATRTPQKGREHEVQSVSETASSGMARLVRR